MQEAAAPTDLLLHPMLRLSRLPAVLSVEPA